MARSGFGRRGPPSASAPVGAEMALPIIVRTALALALATPLMALGGWLPDAIFPHVVGKALYFRLWTEIAFAAWVLLIIRYPAYRLPRSWLLIALLVYLGVALAASFAGVSLARSLWSNYERMQGWIGLAHYTAFALMAASILRSSRHWEAALNLNLLVGLLVGLLGLYETTFGTDERVGGTFGNPSFLASYALVNSLIAGGFLARSLAAAAGPDHDDKAVLTESLMRSFWVMVICLDLLMLAQSGTRGAAAGLAAAIFFILTAGALWPGRRALRAACIALVFGVLALSAGMLALRNSPIAAAAGQMSPTVRRLAELSPQASAVESRLGAIRYGLEGFSERPILGWGPENFGAAYDAHVDGPAAAKLYRFDRAHNRIVEELVTTGIIGLLAFGALWLCIGWRLLSRIRALSYDVGVFIVFIGAAFVGYLVQNLFLFDTPGSSVQLYLLIGFVLHLCGQPAPSALVGKQKPHAEEQASRNASGSLRKVVDATAFQVSTSVVVVLSLLAACYVLVVSPYTGATRTHAALSGSRTGEERFALYQGAVSAAPGLANKTVTRFINVLFDYWDSLSDAERERALYIAERDVRAGVARDPHDWQLHAILARLLNRASQGSPALVAKSRLHTDRVAELAPGRIETLQLRVEQYIFEDRHDEALKLIDDYLERSRPYLNTDSETFRGLAEMRDVATGRN